MRIAGLAALLGISVLVAVRTIRAGLGTGRLQGARRALAVWPRGSDWRDQPRYPGRHEGSGR